MAHVAIIPPGSAPPLAPYSPGVRTGNTVYVSGVLAMDGDGNIVGEGDIKAQTRQVIESIKSVVEAAGGALSDVAEVLSPVVESILVDGDNSDQSAGGLNYSAIVELIVYCYRSAHFPNDHSGSAGQTMEP